MDIRAQLKALVGQQVTVDDPAVREGAVTGKLVITGDDAYLVENEAGDVESIFGWHQVDQILDHSIRLELPLEWEDAPGPSSDSDEESDWSLYDEDDDSWP
ncbi:MAG: hypothetical protein KJ077_35720 [Anaerolineae bacterium]|nr:hypothetical protein [Anaerolineae bacterium]